MTTLLPRARLFQTGSLAVPVSRFLCEHLLDELEIIEACISRIHAQDPVVTTGYLSHSLLQNVAGGIDVTVMVCPALRTAPLSLIEPELIEHVPAMRARFARRKPLGDLQNHPARGIAFVKELAADLAERGIVDSAGMHPAAQSPHVQVLDRYQIVFTDQAGGERVDRRLPVRRPTTYVPASVSTR